MSTEKPRFSLTLDFDTYDRLKAYKEEQGYSTKSRAVQALVELGLSSRLELDAPAPAALSAAEESLLSSYRTLNAEGQEKVSDYAADLVASGRYIKNNKADLGKETHTA